MPPKRTKFSSAIRKPRKYAKKKANPKNMKKTTARGAYKKGAKKQMIQRRAPMTELKVRTSSSIALMNGHTVTKKNLLGDPNQSQDYLTNGDPQQPLNWRPIPNEDAFYNIPLSTFLRNQRGIQDYQMLGSDLFSRYLNLRLEVQFPQGEIFKPDPSNYPTDTARNNMIQDNYKLYMVCGFVTAPLNAPINDDSLDRIVRSKITQADLTQHIKSQIQPYFDDNIDPLSFIPRDTSNLKITSYRRIKPKITSQIATQAQGQIYNNATTMQTVATGSIPNVQLNHSWKMNRKITYTYGEQPSPEVENQNNYPNQNWLPFCVLFAPNFASLKQQQTGTPGDATQNPSSRHEWKNTDRTRSEVFVRWNDAHYFTDS